MSPKTDDPSEPSTEYLVPLEEIARRLQTGAQAILEWARTAGLPILRNWAGEPSLRPADATNLLHSRDRWALSAAAQRMGMDT